jgi:hypothetical protein
MQRILGRGEAYTGYLAGNPEGKRPLDRASCRWEDNIKIYLQELEFGGMDCIDLVQHRERWRALVNAVKNFRVL